MSISYLIVTLFCYLTVSENIVSFFIDISFVFVNKKNMDSDLDDEIPLAQIKRRSETLKLNNESHNDSDESDSEDSDIISTGSEYTQEICDVKRCTNEASIECDECSMALCTKHEIPKTKCKEKHRLVKPREEKIIIDDKNEVESILEEILNKIVANEKQMHDCGVSQTVYQQNQNKNKETVKNRKNKQTYTKEDKKEVRSLLDDMINIVVEREIIYSYAAEHDHLSQVEIQEKYIKAYMQEYPTEVSKCRSRKRKKEKKSGNVM